MIRDAIAQGIREAKYEAAPGASGDQPAPPPSSGSGNSAGSGGLLDGSYDGADAEPLPPDEDEAPAMRYRRTRRKRRSGLYDYDDEDATDDDELGVDDEFDDDREGW